MTHEKPGYQSELSSGLKKRFWVGVGGYIAGFLVLWSIGESINKNGYVFTAFLAPFLVLGSVGFMVWNFVRKDKHEKSGNAQ